MLHLVFCPRYDPMYCVEVQHITFTLRLNTYFNPIIFSWEFYPFLGNKIWAKVAQLLCYAYISQLLSVYFFFLLYYRLLQHTYYTSSLKLGPGWVPCCLYVYFKCPIILVPYDGWEKCSIWCNDECQWKLKYAGITRPSATLCTTDPQRSRRLGAWALALP
jgi:hypothetical protein